MEFLDGPHPATLDDEVLLRSCQVHFGRTSGPGGQNRNRRDTATTVEHLPTGIIAAATERRSQAQNRNRALFRLRQKLRACVGMQLGRAES